MADSGIKISISPGASTAGAGGRRLTESPSFVSDKFGGPRLTAPSAAPGTGQRSEINNAQRDWVAALRANTAEIRAWRAQVKATAPNSAERSALQAQIKQGFQQRDALLASPFGKSELGRETTATTEAVAGMPGAAQRGVDLAQRLATAAKSLIGIGRETFQGNPAGALRQAVSGVNAFAGGRYLSGGGGSTATGAAEGAATDIAGGAAAGGAEAAGGIGIGSILGVTGTAAALALGGYEAYKHRDLVAGIAESPLALFLARRYSRDEATRQTQAYGYAREFGEAGGPLSAYTRGSRFSALGMDAQQALDVTGGMREAAGASNVSESQAYRTANLGTAVGLSNADISAIGGQAGKLGIDPEQMIDVVAKGVERGGQRGLQGEVGRATLDYLRTQSQLGTADERKAAETVTGMAALLGASGIAVFKGGGAVTQGVAGITAANQPGDLFGVESVGAAYTTIGQTRLLQEINRDPRYKRMSALDRVAMADRILTQGLTGPNSRMYLRDVVAPEIEQAKAQGLYGLESLEKQFGFPVGDQSDKLVTGSLLTAAESGDVSAYLKLKSQLEANGPGQIPAATTAMASHAMAASAAGASSMRTFTGVENAEAAMLRRLAIAPSTDRNVASLLNKFAGEISPSSVTGPASEMSTIPAGDATRIAKADLSGFNLPPMLRAEMGGAPATATTPGGDSARDSTLQSVGLAIVSAINLLITTIASAYPPANFSAAPSPTTPALPSPSRPDKKRISMK